MEGEGGGRISSYKQGFAPNIVHDRTCLGLPGQAGDSQSLQISLGE